MKIGIEGSEDLKFHLEMDGDDVVVVDNNGFRIVRFQVFSDTGKVYLSTEDDIDRDHYEINAKKGHTDIEVIS